MPSKKNFNFSPSMGSQYQFTCAKCAYTVEVSGGNDAGMLVTTTTIVCENCRTLSDVVTAKHEDFPKERPLRCPTSPRHRVKRWQNGDPCPHCGTPLIQGNLTLLWD